MEKILIHAFADEASPLVEKQIAAMIRNGLNGVELRKTDTKTCVTISISEASEIRRKLDDAGLTVWALGSPIGKIALTDNFDAHMELLRHALEIANILGTPNLRMFSFYLPKEQNPSLFKNEVIDKLGIMLEVAKSYGVQMCHENEKGIFGDTASRCLELLSTFSEMKGVFDPANFIQCGQDTWQAWQILKPYIKYMHIKDALEDGRVVPAGFGAGNLAKIIPAYIAQGGHVFSIEPHLRVNDGFGPLVRKDKNGNVYTYYSCAEKEAAFDVACQNFQNLLKEILL